MLIAPRDWASKNILPTTAYMFAEAIYKNKRQNGVKNNSKKIKNSNTFLQFSNLI
jgi:hypothetical protein